MKAIVLAAGKGVRLKPLTNEIPKVMIQVRGKPLLELILEKLVEAGIEETILIVGYKKEKIVEYFGKEFSGMKLNYVVQKEQLGTAHAIGLAKGFVQRNFLVLNGDVLVETKLLRELVEAKDIVIVGREVEDPSRYGCIEIENGFLKNVVEKPAKGEEPSNIVNAGIYVFSKNIFDAISETKKSKRGEFEITDSLKKLLAREKARVKLYRGKVLDIATLEDLEEANKFQG